MDGPADLGITADEQLGIFESADPTIGLTDSVVKKIKPAIKQGTANALLQLASLPAESGLSPSARFWRIISHDFFHALCQQSGKDPAQWTHVVAPDQLLERRSSEAPPMMGAERLSAELLARWWSQLASHVSADAATFEGSPEEYLHSIHPVFCLMGRVTFHLAENKRDANRPFAFMATYASRISSDSRLKHLPLARAVEQFAGQRNRAALENLLEPVKRAAQSCQLVQRMLESKTLFRPQAWEIPQAYQFLREVPHMESSGVVVRVPDWWNRKSPPRPQVNVSLDTGKKTTVDADSLLKFSVDLALDGEPLSPKEQRQILESTEGLVLLRGRWVEVDQQRLQATLSHWEQLREEAPDGVSFVQGLRLLAGASMTESDEAGIATSEWSRVIAGPRLRETLDRLRDPEHVDREGYGHELKATLRPYQEVGVQWLWLVDQMRLGGCLADDMGLGKTVQMIGFLLMVKRQLKRQKRHTPSLLVMPASLLGNWKDELSRFAPSIRLLVAHSSEADGEQLDAVQNDPAEALSEVDVVATTYGMLRRMPWLHEVTWRIMALDEAQAIKNPTAAQTKAAKRLKADTRLVLTGTPVENSLRDLWSLFDFCSPGLLGSLSQFKSFIKQASTRSDGAAFAPLRRLVRPYILRRLKTDPKVISDLPQKTEMCVRCTLSKKQATLYQATVRELSERLESADGIARHGVVLATLAQLKQICNHPAQFLQEAVFPEKDSGKFQRLSELCEPIRQRQEKALVFTQYRGIADPLSHYLAGVFGTKGLVLHGGTSVARRKKLVEAFQNDARIPFFVISLKAGGSGLNLTAANHVIHFDRWWNPAVENQATDRAFRIGQSRNVMVHKFVCQGTIEERIDRMITEKTDLADEVLAMGVEKQLTDMPDEELLSFVGLDLRRATTVL